MPSAADTLLTLFDHVDDVGQIEILIEAKNLRRVMHAAGHDDEAMRTMIAAGETPGSMLLGVLKSGRTAEELVALIPPEDRVVSEAPAASPKRPTHPRDSASDAPGSTLSLPGFVLVACGAIFSALAVKIPDFGLLLLLYWPAAVGVTAILGAVGGFMVLERKRVAGVIIGAITAPLATFVAFSYILWMALSERESC